MLSAAPVVEPKEHLRSRMATNPNTATASAPRLRRTLTLWDLILYGVIVI